MHLAEIHPVRSLFFDLDGTLVDSCPGIVASLSIAFRAAGKMLPPGDFGQANRVHPSVSSLHVLIQLLPSRTSPTSRRPFAPDYDSDGWKKTVLFEGVVPGACNGCSAMGRNYSWSPTSLGFPPSGFLPTSA